jgi:hypothetical protein
MLACSRPPGIAPGRSTTSGRHVLQALPIHSRAAAPCRSAHSRRGWKPQQCRAAADAAAADGAAAAAAFPALAHPDVAHFLNLTNGLEAAPLLRRLGLPFTLVRLQSTVCEQQRFDALVGGADAALLAAAALGRTCLVWDFGSRGDAALCAPPRAIWYGLEFLVWAASRKWFPAAAGGRRRRAHLRGHDVTPTFEAALRGGRGWGADAAAASSSSPPSSAAAGTAGSGGESEGDDGDDATTGSDGQPGPLPPGFDPARSGVSRAAVVRLRYFRRFVPPGADPATHIRLWGAHRPTDRDGDAAWHTALAAAECGPGGSGDGGGGGGGRGARGAGARAAAPGPGAAGVTGPDGRVDPAALAADLARLGGFGLFTGGVPHDKEGGVPPAVLAARARRGRG